MVIGIQLRPVGAQGGSMSGEVSALLTMDGSQPGPRAFKHAEFSQVSTGFFTRPSLVLIGRRETILTDRDDYRQSIRKTGL